MAALSALHKQHHPIDDLSVRSRLLLYNNASSA
jgi:hypothetical protein